MTFYQKNSGFPFPKSGLSQLLASLFLSNLTNTKWCLSASLLYRGHRKRNIVPINHPSDRKIETAVKIVLCFPWKMKEFRNSPLYLPLVQNHLSFFSIFHHQNLSRHLQNTVFKHKTGVFSFLNQNFAPKITENASKTGSCKSKVLMLF